MLLVLLWIHRSYFAQAIIDCPTNPLRSQYASSFLATYRASVIILKTIKNNFVRFPSLCARFWQTWTYAFSAAVSSSFSVFRFEFDFDRLSLFVCLRAMRLDLVLFVFPPDMTDPIAPLCCSRPCLGSS